MNIVWKINDLKERENTKGSDFDKNRTFHRGPIPDNERKLKVFPLKEKPPFACVLISTFFFAASIAHFPYNCVPELISL